ncbi:MAG TPA: hypothetical protein P5158_14205, partial [Chitinophagaceae bacterium]|nr:hypothetical protein [Chitinophagaceae bacterium]
FSGICRLVLNWILLFRFFDFKFFISLLCLKVSQTLVQENDIEQVLAGFSAVIFLNSQIS